MRANERKGAWALMTGIVVLGFILWIFGKCQGSSDSFSDNNTGNPGVEVRTLPADSVENSGYNGHSRKAKNRKERNGGDKNTADRKKRRSKKSKRKNPVRDILADTIPTR